MTSSYLHVLGYGRRVGLKIRILVMLRVKFRLFGVRIRGHVLRSDSGISYGKQVSLGSCQYPKWIGRRVGLKGDLG